MQKFTYLLLTLATLLFAEHLMAQEIEYPSNKPILSALSDDQAPGYYRKREKHGIGIGIGNANGIYSATRPRTNEDPPDYYSLFYDRAISSIFKIHFFLDYSLGAPGYVKDYSGTYNCDAGPKRGYWPPQYCPNMYSIAIEVETKRIGVSLRNFPSYKSGFFWGIGGGPIEYYQEFINPHWEQPYTPSPLYFKGIQYFIDLGWQGYDGFYFTINTRIGSTIVTEEQNEPNTEYFEFTEKSRNSVMKIYEAAKNPRAIMYSFGWHF